MRKFKYKSVFESCVIRASLNVEETSFLSEASIEDLKNIGIPESINLKANPDLLFTVYNGAVINRANRNGDCIDKSTALSIKNNFVHKPVNLEHDRKKIVGHIVKAGWSSFGENKLLNDKDVENLEDPFNLVIGSVVYRLNHDKFADLLIDSNDESSQNFNTIHSSWEIGFDDYQIMVGSKNVSEAEIITDSKKILEYSKYLKQNGGSGETPDGKFVGRLIVGNAESVIPIGFAYTGNPAAEVEGVAVMDYSDIEENKDEDIDAKYDKKNKKSKAFSKIDNQIDVLFKVFSKK